MHLLYLDESGKSGPKDFSQPWYVLGGLIVHEGVWRSMERDLDARIDGLVPPPRHHTWELHMAHIFHGKGHFKRMPRATRTGLVDAVFDVMDEYAATLIFVGVDKRAHHAKYRDPSPVEDIGYRFMIERFESYLSNQQADQLGVVVCDEQKELETVTRKAHSGYRRWGTGWQAINHVIETPFFTPSHWSRMLQMIDVATY